MRIGILSFAHLHAEAYIHNLRAIPGVEMIGLADEDEERGRRFARLFEARLFESYEALLAERPDGVVVCSENSKHRPLVELAAAAGAHVLCEKPLATTLADAQAMMAACDRAGVHLMTAFPMRFSAPLLEVKARLEAGELGEVYCFNATNQGELPKHHRAWFVDKELAGGGAVMDHTVHLADVMRWYLSSEVVEVYAQTNRIFYADEVEVETGGLLMLTFARTLASPKSGVFATIDCSWSKPPYYPTWGGLTFEMVTDRGAVLVDAFKQNLTIYRHDLRRPVWGYWGSDANQAMIEEFVAAIREDRQPGVSGLDGYRAVEVALAAYESAGSGQPVRLN
ncbi:MAG: Gfo/Idh/MocA family oxidoreductase [Chloroflexi bacterium]|nr:Gfo/Idh/MocA family oxidoreductase [Chloroflexota bacterium]MCI0576916.1 Gfo/Idh/MocA family oxidoreductase [Chloroflexota bacterium]MCI0649696.1 Gfo/Idh/MocA family oxidoreductase [Chloroflexota bacterium]MCI0729941.1 Gfo/Idh/MocA family oxidoreductase [Chloroflexota bacterium]